MRAAKRDRSRAVKTARERLEKSRAEALRESFRLGDAMQDLKRTADGVQVVMIELDRAVRKTQPEV